jgi:hypothetical protein
MKNITYAPKIVVSRKELVNSNFGTYNTKSVSTSHPDYNLRFKEWTRIRDCMKGEDVIKSKGETYLPRPSGMKGNYASAYDPYKERAHFPLIVPYALQGALGVIITKLPEFKVPKQLEYIIKESTKDGRSLQQLFMDIIIEIFQTGRNPIAVDIVEEINQFRFVQYKAEDLINWKSYVGGAVKSISLATLKGSEESTTDIFSHAMTDTFRVLTLGVVVDPISKLEKPSYKIEVYGEGGINGFVEEITPNFMGRTIDEIPLFIAGSINNSFNIQPIPLISVANCSIQIYRKEADLANSEFLSCNPTLCVVGAENNGNLPNVVGSSVMIVIPNELARIFYTQTDTAALTHVSSHIQALYEEAIRHGVSILDSRKGVEAAEALRIRQATQSASLYSIYSSALNVLMSGLKMMCKWAGYDPEEVDVDAPTSLTFGIPDAALLKELVAGFGESGIIPINVVHRYMVSSGLLDQTISIDDYVKMLEENKALKEKLGLTQKDKNVNPDLSNNAGKNELEGTTDQKGTPKPKKDGSLKVVDDTENKDNQAQI